MRGFALAPSLVPRLARSSASGGGVADRARRLGQRAHGQQHALHVGMRDDRARRRRARRLRGPAGARAHRPAPAGWRARRSRRPAAPTASRAWFIIVNMQAMPRFSSPIRQPIAPPLSPNTMVQVGEAWMPSLCSIECARTSLRAPGEPSGVEQELRHQEQRDAARAGRRVGQPRQHEVDDVVGQVVLAVGDEDLLAGDAIAAVAGALGAGAQRADVGARLRLGQVHRAHPLAGDELRQIAALELLAAVRGERVDPRHGQQRPEPEGHGGRVPHLDAGRVEPHAAAPGRPIASAPRARSSRPAPRRGRPPSSRAAW